MIYAALGALLVAGLSSMGTVHIVRALIRQHAREREALLNKIMHLAGRTWEPPPSAEPPAVADELEMLLDPVDLPYLSEG